MSKRTKQRKEEYFENCIYKVYVQNECSIAFNGLIILIILNN